jgi:hypothetical protein
MASAPLRRSITEMRWAKERYHRRRAEGKRPVGQVGQGGIDPREGDADGTQGLLSDAGWNSRP